MDVEVRRGRRHVLGKVDFEGATTWNSRYLEGALREAAPDTLAKGIVTRESVNAALLTLREFYRSKGFLDARLELVDLKPGAARMRGVPLDLTVRVAVDFEDTSSDVYFLVSGEVRILVRTPGGPGGSGSRSVSATTRVRRGVAPV